MLKLDGKLKVSAETAGATNLADRFSADDLARIGNWVWEGYSRDLGSRAEWTKRNQAGMDLALQISKVKNFPWPDCSNVMFPLVTIATMQFHSRAYSALVSGADIVKCKVEGPDPEGQVSARAYRIASHMSYQVLEEDEPWEEQHDRLLINVPIVGTAFKKSYFKAADEHNTSELVLAKDLVLDYYAKSTDSCARKTHIIPAYRNELVEQMLTGVFVDYTSEDWFKADAVPQGAVTQANEDKRAGMAPAQGDESTPFTTLEQHCWLNLDGDDYAEPYIIRIEASTKKVLRIVARWTSDTDVYRTSTGRIYRIEAEEYFTKYGFIPSPDGSIYDIGFGVLLGPLNESVNSIINQLIDAGTMATTAGGFLGRGAKIRGGNYSFSPFEWKRVDSTGDDLQKSIVPHPVRDPSMVLLQLLNLLINYTDRVSGSTDTMVGENPGQNTPAETTRAMVEQGSKIFGAIFKRTWRSMKQEFKKLFLLNARNLPASSAYGSAGGSISREDYLTDPGKICPAADPNMTSEAERKQQAIAIKEDAAASSGYNKDAVTRKFLNAFKVEDIDVIFPGSEKMPPGESEKIALKKMDLELAQAQMQVDQQMFIVEQTEIARLNSAKIVEIETNLQIATKTAQGDDADRQINSMNTMIGLLKQQHQVSMDRIGALHDRLKLQIEAKKASQPAKTAK